MDATMLTVAGTGLTVVGTGIAALVALWRVQGHRFDTMDRRMQERFEASDQRWTERFDAVDKRFEMAEKMNRERFEMAEKMNRERFETMDRRWTERFEMAEGQNRERFETMDRRWTERFETAERQNRAARAAICESLGKLDDRVTNLDDRTRADTAALHGRFDTLNGPVRRSVPPPARRGAEDRPARPRPRRRVAGGPSAWHAGCFHPGRPGGEAPAVSGDRLGG